LTGDSSSKPTCRSVRGHCTTADKLSRRAVDDDR
jgi:hypothetical protein